MNVVTPFKSRTPDHLSATFERSGRLVARAMQVSEAIAAAERARDPDRK